MPDNSMALFFGVGRRERFLSLSFASKVNLPIALAVSLSLHFAALAFLGSAVRANVIFSDRPASLTNAPLIVNIVKPDNRSQPVVTSSSVPIAESPRKPAALNTQQRHEKDALSSPVLVRHERYFLAPELDSIPRVQQDIELYPEELQHFKQGGKVVLSLWINENGHVEKVELVTSELPAIFSEVATRNFMQASFMPGKKNNLAVKSKVDAVLVFPSHDSRS